MMLRVTFPRRCVVITPTMIIFILSMMMVHLSYVATQCGSMTSDRQDKLALYKVILRTYWSRARFPRHYPEWRPPAQFGKLIGRTHDSTYSLYRLGERLTPGATQYVETGRTDGLDTGGDSPNILDAFGAPGVPQGEGTSVSRAFFDGNHTLVSVMARINPSPDWFIGVDSFQLCVEGNWVDTVTVELDPLDGGTDNGFTFTAANWPTNPQGIAYRITSKYPAHPAGSFYYPNLPRLPPIATLTFTKLKEYTLTETYHEDEVEMEFVSSEKQLQSYDVTPRGIDPNRELNEAIAEERREMDNQRYRYWTTGSSSSLSSSPDESKNNKMAIINSIASSYGNYVQSRSRLPSTPTPFPRLANSQENRSKQETTLYKSTDALVEAQKAQIYEDIQRRIANVTSSSLNRRLWRNNSSVINNRERQHKLRMKHHRYSTKGKRIRGRRTHDSTYSLYRLGERLTPGATQYVETGRTDGLDTGGDSPNILDAFGAPGVPQGEGTSVSRAFFDGNHTLVSVMARINPSPDWFIGVDSFQLCVEGNWVDTVTVELDPLDGGTDNGFTFTAANWPTNPQGIAYRITSKYPAHPAGSFYYPNLPRLPPIATLTFTKLKEYTLTETYHEDEVEMEFVSSEKQLQSYDVTPRGIDPNRELNEAIAEERREMDNQRYRYWTTGSSSSLSSSPDESKNNKMAIINSIASSYGNYVQSRSRLPSTPTPFPRLANSQENRSKQETTLYKSTDALVEAQKAQIYEDIQRRIANVTSSSLNRRLWRNNSSVINNRERQHKLRMKHHRYSTKGKRIRGSIPRDCKVGDWGAWSACSRSCGVGETQRTRKVIVKPRRGGKQCPPLKETKWCGSVTPCHDNTAKPVVDFFSW